MALEKWAAIGSLGLFAMFAAEMISVYYFMANPPDNFEFGTVFEANPKILQFISIGVAPGSILAALSFIMSRRFGSRQNGMVIASGGGVMLAGMAYCNMLLGDVKESYITDAVNMVPPLFMAVSVGVIAAGLQLFKIKKRRPKKDYLS